jgi:hypothetical protein
MLFRHTRTYSVAESAFSIDGPGLRFELLTYPDSRRDMFIRVSNSISPVTNVHFYVTRTLAEALALPTGILGGSQMTAGGVIAYSVNANFSAGFAGSVILNNWAAVAPDVSGLAISYVTATAPTAHFDAVYGYTAAPGALAIDEIDYLLGTRMGSGQLLDGFSAARVVKGPGGLVVTCKTPHGIASIGDETDAPAEAGGYASECHFSVVLATRGEGTKGEEAFADVAFYARGIASLLGDEWNTLNGLTTGVEIEGVAGPDLASGADEPGYVMARVDGVARFPTMRSDR